VALPISHIFGLVGLHGQPARRAALHLVPRFTAEGLADALEHDGITVLPGVPAMYTGCSNTRSAPAARSARRGCGSRTRARRLIPR
jgi:acyl-CoA synthetase (AMP-forming)/AMP-acid ligase II